MFCEVGLQLHFVYQHKNLQQFKIRSSSTKTPGGKLSSGYPGGKLSVEAISVCERTIDEAPGLHILHSDSQCHEKRPTQGPWLDQFVVLARFFVGSSESLFI